MDSAALWVLFGLLFFALTYVHQKRFDSPTPVSRLNLLHALWQHGTFRIDAFSHALAVGLLAVALWAIDRQAALEGGGIPPEAAGARAAGRGLIRWLGAGRWDLLAGFACGWVVASEYTAGLIVVALGLWVVRSGWERGLRFVLGAAPPLLLIPAYSWICLGDPFTLPYSHQASFPAMREGLYAIKWPDLETAYRLLLGPTRGLLFWTPFLVMAGFGSLGPHRSGPAAGAIGGSH